MLLSHIGEYASEYESLKFPVNSRENCEKIANIFTSVIPPRPLITNALLMPYERCNLANAYRN